MSQPLEDTIKELKRFIEQDVTAGFSTREEIVETAVGILSDEASPSILQPIAEEFAKEMLARHATEQATWPPITDCDRLDQAFADLEEHGVISRQNFSCCGTCGAGEIRDEIETIQKAGRVARGYTFYHDQDTESAVEGFGICLAYGATEEGEAAALSIAREIIDALNRNGLKTAWGGSWSKRIEVSLDWKRRR